jgi:hypothetical protein
METERFNYSYETMNSGVEEIDETAIEAEDTYKDNIPIQEESDKLVDFSESDPFSDGEY